MSAKKESLGKTVGIVVAVCLVCSIVVSGAAVGLRSLQQTNAALDKKTQLLIQDLSAYHSVAYSQANDLGDFPKRGEGLGSIFHAEAYLRPLVKVHPETGVKNLFIGRHAFGIPGLTRDESKKLLQELMNVVVSDQRRVYSHSWRVGDLLMWDNRALLHRARPYDYAQPRVLMGTRVAGDPKSELAYYPEDSQAVFGREALASELKILREETSRLLFEGSTENAFT